MNPSLIMDNDAGNNPLLERANAVLADGDSKYAMFLYREALKKEPENLEIREALHKVRKSACANNNSFWGIFKQLCTQAKIFYQKQRKSSANSVIDSIEEWMDANPNNFDGCRMLAKAAMDEKLHKLAEFSINEIPEDMRTRDDSLMLAQALMEQKKFDQSLKIANSILGNYPEDPDAKDIIWKSSVDKQMNQKVDLMMADGIKTVAPPRVDASQIVLSNPQTDEKKDEKDGKSKQKK